jgi:3D (Asp-Asp-Asp) domain-containing protein
MKFLLKLFFLAYFIVAVALTATSVHAARVVQTYPFVPPEPAKEQQPDPVATTPTAAAVSDVEAATEAPGEIYTLTGYCPCVKCCGVWSAEHPSRVGTDYIQRTASGTVPTAGRTVGADWGTLPPGTVIEIEGYGRRVVEDKPAAFVVERYGGKIIDLYFDTHEEAAAAGKQEVMVKVVNTQ